MTGKKGITTEFTKFLSVIKKSVNDREETDPEND